MMMSMTTIHSLLLLSFDAFPLIAYEYSPVDAQMVSEFIRLQGLERIYRLLLQQRDDLSGYLFGQLLNCLLYSSSPVQIQAQLVRMI